MRCCVNLLAVGLLTTWLAGPALAADDLVELVKQVEKSVVHIKTPDASGSGVIVDQHGWVLTNYHVIEGSAGANITLRSGVVVTCDGVLNIATKYDLALLKIPPVDPSMKIKLANELPRQGERVAAFGGPLGITFSTSDGIVSGVRTGKQLREFLGSILVDAQGYADDSTWIQTTAPISHGNSGGPLVNMSGEVVGLNTWTRLDGQNLNFAISVVHVRRLLESVSPDKKPRSFKELPKPRAHIERPIAKLEDFRLVLPTGKTFSYASFGIKPIIVPEKLESGGLGVVVIRHPNGALYAAAQQIGGQLNGITLGQHDNEKPMLSVTYENGRRHGVMKTWDDGGSPQLFGLYSQGKRHGFLCWHENGHLRLILQYKNDELEFIQMMAGFDPVEGFKDRAVAEKNKTAKELLEHLDKFEADSRKAELAFRKQVKDAEMQRRKVLAAQLAPEKRRLQAERGAARAAAEESFTRELYRKAYGR